MKKLKSIKYSNEGAAGMVAAVLLIGLLFSFIAFIQAVYVPQWMEQKEAEHMEQVAIQFTQFKSSIDILTINEKPLRPITSPITLGSKEMPFFSSSRSYGSLDLKPNDFRITLEDDSKNISFSLGTIEYKSQNAYFVNQNYIYENGALILDQISDNIFVVIPSIYLSDKDTIEINLIKLQEKGNKCSASGYGTYPIQTRFSEYIDISTDYTFDHVQNITIISSYNDAWKDFFNRTFSKDFNFTITNTTNNEGIIIKFANSIDQYPFVDVHLFEIDVQISRGWIE